MTALRHQRAALSLGQAVPTLGAGYAAPSTRYCARCQCRLSRYANQTETMCAPCHAALWPWAPPRLPITRKHNACPSCGGFKDRRSHRCRACADAGITLNFLSHRSL